MARLPIPGQDNGTWGDILNDYLSQSHAADGALKPGVVGSSQIASGAVTSTQLANNTVTAAQIANGTITEAQLASALQTKIDNSAADASPTSKGLIQLAGDLAGTAASPTVPGLATKEPTITAGTSSQYYRGDKSWQTLDKTAVGLSNVDNTSDTAKNSATVTLTNKTISGASNTITNIANSSLSNSSMTIAGNVTALGSSVTQDQITGLTSTGLVKRTGANALATATAGSDYQLPRNVVSVTSAVTLANSAGQDVVALIGASGAPTLPTAISNSNRYTVKNVDTTPKTLTTTSGQTIDGASSLMLPAGASYDLISDGSNWKIDIGYAPLSASVNGDFVLDRQQPDHFIQFTRKPDASVAPAALDSGLPTTLYVGNAGAANQQHVISNGFLTYNPTSGSTAAAYFQAQLPATATRIGCRFRWDGAGSTTGGTVCIAILSAAPSTSGGVLTSIPNIGLHLVTTKTQWILSYWDGTNGGNTGIHTVLSDNYSTFGANLLDNVDYEIEAWVSGNTVTMHLPNGEWITATNVNIGSRLGPYVFLENFSNAATTDNHAKFSKFWASSSPSSPPLNLPSRIARSDGSTQDITLTANTNTLVTNCISKVFQVPASGEIIVRFSAHLKVISSATVNYEIDLLAFPSAAFVSFAAGYYAVSGTFEARRTVEEHITGLTPGTFLQAVPYVKSTASDTHFMTNGAERATLVIEPVLL